MLIFSRKKNESVIFQTPEGLVTVTILETHRNKTRVGIEAPKKVPVHRGEIHAKLQNKPETLKGR
jgi:carbon storage regulator CsrA